MPTDSESPMWATAWHDVRDAAAAGPVGGGDADGDGAEQPDRRQGAPAAARDVAGAAGHGRPGYRAAPPDPGT